MAGCTTRPGRVQPALGALAAAPAPRPSAGGQRRDRGAARGARGGPLRGRAAGGRAVGPGPDAELLADLSALGEDLLPDWTDEWLTVERESHRQRRLHALERCSTYLREVGRYGDALAAGLTAVHSEPLRESAHRRVIEAHLAEGNDAEALRQFDGYRRLMADELGLPPSPVIRRMVSHLTGRPVDLPGR
ncbi:AfsR/SARP family transcriptional regulator [Nocardioides aurantiacus]|uniref:AfsR/SARP family transcriptional regulator n=1 Tax=Nocardioides aurantiacus TaxID=86796 RepID=UPI00403F424E